MRLYLAGPLFSTAECNFNTLLATLLRDHHGHEVFLPQEHEQRADRPKAIFQSDVNGMEWAHVIVANLDGSDPDSGTCWELGYFYAKGKPSIVFRTDFRLFEGADKVNLMMTESADHVIIARKLSVTKLAKLIDERLQAIKNDAAVAEERGG